MSRPLPFLARVNLGLLAGLTAALSLLLWPQWRTNPDLSHGLFMLPVFGALLWESRSGTPRYLPDRAWVTAALAGAVLLGLLALSIGGIYAASLDWTHPVVLTTLTVAFTLLLGAALFAFARDSVRLLPLNWSSLAAVGLWLLCFPLPPGTYSQLTLHLQLMVTETVLHTLHLFGIPAIREGNVLTLAATTVGVEEACSGVRSLLSCVFAGVFFSATLVRRPRRRAALLLLAPLLALGMNLLRSLTLTLLANAGVDIAGTWHDVTGFAVLGVTAAILGGLALLLERPRASSPAAPAAPPATHPAVRGPSQVLLALGLALSLALTGFFYSNTRPSARHDEPVPALLALLPASIDGWQVATSRELYQFADILQTEHLAQRTYLRRRADGQGVDQITFYLAYWRAGQAPVSLVASHTPDACWPGSGWTSVPQANARAALSVDRRTLPPAESRLFLNGLFRQHVWFWHLYDGRSIAYRDPYSVRELFKIALRYGFSHDGDQLFVRVSSNRDWPELADDPLLTTIFRDLAPLGL